MMNFECWISTTPSSQLILGRPGVSLLEDELGGDVCRGGEETWALDEDGEKYYNININNI